MPVDTVFLFFSSFFKNGLKIYNLKKCCFKTICQMVNKVANFSRGKMGRGQVVRQQGICEFYRYICMHVLCA